MKIPPARIVFSGDDRREILALIDESLRSGALTLGPRTRAFEDAFARRHDVEHAVAVASGTAALEIVRPPSARSESAASATTALST